MNWAELIRELREMLISLPSGRFYAVLALAALAIFAWMQRGG